MNLNSKCSHGRKMFGEDCTECELVWEQKCLRAAYAAVHRHEKMCSELSASTAAPVTAPVEPMSFDEYWDRVWTDTLEDRSLTPRAIAMAAWLGARLTAADESSMRMCNSCGWVTTDAEQCCGECGSTLPELPVSHRARAAIAAALSTPASPATPIAQDRPETTGPVAPDGYAYRYSNYLGGTTIYFNHGESVNGNSPIEAVPYWFSGPTSPARAVDDAMALIAAERKRQIEKEGYTAAHDADHYNGEIESAAACYAEVPHKRRFYSDPRMQGAPIAWPWDWVEWKPTPDDRIRELVKAGALIAAAIDQRRAALAPSTARAEQEGGG